MRLILDLFGGTGAWSLPYYLDPRYRVVIVDPRASRSRNDLRITVQEYLRHLKTNGAPRVHGVLGAFPCQHFAGSGSRWWKNKDAFHPELLAGAINNATTMLEIIEMIDPKGWWCFENPVGRAPRCVPGLGKWVMTFNPCDYGGWLDPPGDHYTKRTCLWGRFKEPEKRPVQPVPIEKNWVHRMGRKGGQRGLLRAVTPKGFAKAFKEANP